MSEQPTLTPVPPIDDKRTHAQILIEHLRSSAFEWFDTDHLALDLGLTIAQAQSASSRGYTQRLEGWDHVERSDKRPYQYRYNPNVTRLDDGATLVNVPSLTIIGELPSGVLLCKHDDGRIFAASPITDVVTARRDAERF